MNESQIQDKGIRVDVDNNNYPCVSPKDIAKTGRATALRAEACHIQDSPSLKGMKATNKSNRKASRR